MVKYLVITPRANWVASTGDDFHVASTLVAFEYVDGEHAPKQLCPRDGAVAGRSIIRTGTRYGALQMTMCAGTGTLVAQPILGGIHHDDWRAV